MDAGVWFVGKATGLRAYFFFYFSSLKDYHLLPWAKDYPLGSSLYQTQMYWM